MILRLGIASLLAAFAVAAVVTFAVIRSGEAEDPPQARPVASVEENTVEEPASDDGFDPGTPLDLPDAESAPEPQPEEPEAETPAPEPQPAEPEEQREELVPEPPEDQEPPSPEDVAAANKPRHYAPRSDAPLTLTIRRMQIYNAPVLNSLSPQALMKGVIHVPQTPMPWDDVENKNVYLAGHRVGYGGTASRMLFYNLDRLREGDLVVLKDRRGRSYEYRVSEIFVVRPYDGWVADAVRGRDMVTLQTCTYPTFENRLIVRADRV